MKQFVVSLLILACATSKAYAQYGDSDIAPSPWDDVIAEELMRDTVRDRARGSRSGETTICTGKRHIDRLSERILILLNNYKYCNLFTRADYKRFLNDIPSEQHYAVNYYAWAMGSRLASPAEAKRLEDGFFGQKMMEAAPVASADMHPQAGSHGQPDLSSSNAGNARTARLPQAGGNQGQANSSADDEALGACGLPYPNDNTRQVQEISAKNGMCDWYRENVGADGQ